MSNRVRVGLYGGTFDPIHSGHLHVISELLRRGLVDEVIIIPAGSPWMRENAPSATAQERLEMADLAVAELPGDQRARVRVSDMEIQRKGPSYTIETVEALQKENPNSQFVLILGSDAFAGIAKWHRSEELQKMVEIIVVARDGAGIDIDALDISSTVIRESLNSPKGTMEISSEDLPESIWKYIQERNLYASK